MYIGQNIDNNIVGNIEQHPNESIPNFDYSIYKAFQGGRDESLRSIKMLLNSFDGTCIENNTNSVSLGNDEYGVNENRNGNIGSKGYIISNDNTPKINNYISKELHSNRVTNNLKNKITLSNILKKESTGLQFHKPEIKNEIVEKLTKSLQKSRVIE